MSMKKPHLLVLTGATVCACVMATQFAPEASAGRDRAGADMTVCRLTEMGTWGTSGGIAAYTIGTTAQNVSGVNMAWIASTERHPVIAQNIYRIKDGRFEQIGMSWLKHGWCAADSSVCGACQNVGGCDWLGPGCADTYGSGLNGDQSDLGPRSQVNPWSGVFPYPHSSPVGNNTLRGRIQVAVADVNPALNTGAIYIGEGQYVHPDDAGRVTANNNNSWRRILVGNATGGTWDLEFQSSDPTHITIPAIEAWRTFDPTVSVVQVPVPGDGLFYVGTKVSDNGDGTWHYEYAVFNMNSDRCGQSFSVPVPNGVTMTNVEFRDVAHHSGEPYSSDDWTSAHDAGVMKWETEDFSRDVNANALRWGTMYNFRFDADSPPQNTAAEIGLFKTGAQMNVTVATQGPAPIACLGDIEGDDQVIDVFDLLELLSNWGTSGDGADLADPADTVDLFDLLELLASWGNC